MKNTFWHAKMTEDIKDILQIPIAEFLTKSDEERLAEIEEGLRNKNVDFDIVDEPHKLEDLVKLIEADEKENRVSPLPESENWLGNYNFHVDFSMTSDSISVYSQSRDKLYLVPNTPFAFMFTTQHPPPAGSYLRIMSVFIDPQFSKFDVHRCYNHAMTDFQNGIGAADHLIRCDNHPGKYVRNSLTLRRSLILPFSHNSADLSVTHKLKFMCVNFCPGGMNRRRIRVIFTLECSGVVIGRRSLEVKVCSRPSKCLENDEKLAAKSASIPMVQRPEFVFPVGNLKEHAKHSSPHPPKKPRLDAKSKKREIRNDISQFFKQACDAYHKTNASTGGPYLIEVQNKEEYEVLMLAKASYEFNMYLRSQVSDLKHKKPKKRD